MGGSRIGNILGIGVGSGEKKVLETAKCMVAESRVRFEKVQNQQLEGKDERLWEDICEGI